MKRSVVLFVMLIVVSLVRAQFDAQIGQYMFLQSSFNVLYQPIVVSLS